MGFSVRPLTSAVGAEIHGVDLTAPLDADTVAGVRRALLDHLVVFFREQPMTAEQHLMFASLFGPVQLPLFENKATERPGYTVIEQTSPQGSGTDVWHADSTFMVEPPLGAVLRAVTLPSVGGDTCFASMAAAYERLSPSLQRYLDTLDAVHSVAKVMALVARLPNAEARGDAAAVAEVVHPVVRVHPESGRRALFVSSNWVDRIVGLAPDESDALLELLYATVHAPEVQCRFRWEPDSVAFWDNRITQHYAVADYCEPRVMARVMVAGDVPAAVAR
jgi:taurine dioxygenase